MQKVDAAIRSDVAHARTPAQKASLATKLMELAIQSKDTPDEQFALYSKAREIAIQGGDASTAFAAIDKLDESFQIDALAMTADALAKIVGVLGPHFDQELIFDRCDSAIDTALMADQFEIAKRVADSATTAAHKTGNPTAIKRASARAAKVGPAQAAFGKQKSALSVLDTKPTDPDANLMVGQYRCFVKGDWKNGIPCLARGSDPALKAVAVAELSATDDPRVDIALGNAWLDVADKSRGPEQNAIQRRAIKWFDDAGPSLEGLARLKVDKLRASMAVDGGWLSGAHMSPDEVATRFTFPNKTFKISGEIITADAGNCDDHNTFVWLSHPETLGSFEFGFAIKSRWYQIIAVDIDGQEYGYSRGHWQNAASAMFGPQERRQPGSVEDPSNWALMKLVVEPNKVTFFYNGQRAGSYDLSKPLTRTSMVKVGFSSHQTEFSVKDVYLLKK